MLLLSCSWRCSPKAFCLFSQFRFYIRRLAPLQPLHTTSVVQVLRLQSTQCVVPLCVAATDATPQSSEGCPHCLTHLISKRSGSSKTSSSLLADWLRAMMPWPDLQAAQHTVSAFPVWVCSPPVWPPLLRCALVHQPAICVRAAWQASALDSRNAHSHTHLLRRSAPGWRTPKQPDMPLVTASQLRTD